MYKAQRAWVFTNVFRMQQWEKYIPKVFIFQQYDAFAEQIPLIIDTQQKLIDKLGYDQAPDALIIIDTEAALTITVPIIEKLKLKILFTDEIKQFELPNELVNRANKIAYRPQLTKNYSSSNCP